ncbi:MAG TPA: hypothetical protein VMT34_08015 [Aggregatilineales bacterium]|nr:hypothetical protein [Aggregatilineales bacterium]
MKLESLPPDVIEDGRKGEWTMGQYDDDRLKTMIALAEELLNENIDPPAVNRSLTLQRLDPRTAAAIVDAIQQGDKRTWPREPVRRLLDRRAGARRKALNVLVRGLLSFAVGILLFSLFHRLLGRFPALELAFLLQTLVPLLWGTTATLYGTIALVSGIAPTHTLMFDPVHLARRETRFSR